MLLLLALVVRGLMETSSSFFVRVAAATRRHCHIPPPLPDDPLVLSSSPISCSPSK